MILRPVQYAIITYPIPALIFAKDCERYLQRASRHCVKILPFVRLRYVYPRNPVHCAHICEGLLQSLRRTCTHACKTKALLNRRESPIKQKALYSITCATFPFCQQPLSPKIGVSALSFSPTHFEETIIYPT